MSPGADTTNRARAAIASWLVDRGISGTPAENAVLVVHDLVAHGVERGATDIELKAQVEGDALFIDVTTTFADAAREPPGAEAGTPALRRVRALCDLVDVRDERSRSRHVVCTISLR